MGGVPFNRLIGSGDSLGCSPTLKLWEPSTRSLPLSPAGRLRRRDGRDWGRSGLGRGAKRRRKLTSDLRRDTRTHTHTHAQLFTVYFGGWDWIRRRHDRRGGESWLVLYVDWTRSSREMRS